MTIFLMGCSSNSSTVSLHDAAWNGNVDEIQKQLKEGADVNIKRDQTTLGHIAALKKNKGMMKLLIANGVDLNATDKNGAMPISNNRVIVPGASFAWTVEKTRWPVRANFTAMSAVSPSLISPIKSVSGS